MPELLLDGSFLSDANKNGGRISTLVFLRTQERKSNEWPHVFLSLPVPNFCRFPHSLSLILRLEKYFFLHSCKATAADRF